MGDSNRVEPYKFFLGFLTHASTEEVKNYLEKLRDEHDSIEEQCVEICFHMNGVTWNDVWGMSPLQRVKIIKYVNKINKEREEQRTGQTQM